MIDQEKFGKFIAELRKEAGLSQAELAARLYVGREAVSKWERGVGLPSHTILLGLSKEFDITINELLYGERIDKTNKEEVEKVPYKWIDKISEKLKNFKKLFIVTIILLIIIYLVSYFVFDYTSFKIYATYTSGGDFTFKPGLIVKCYDKLYFKFGNVINYKNDEIIDMTLYYGDIDNSDRVKLLSGSTLEDTVVEIKEFEELTKKDIKEVLQNIYLEITTQSDVEQYKVDVDLNFKSYILSKKLNNENNEDIIESFSETNNENDDIKTKFKLKNGEYIYEFKYKGKKYKCGLQEDTVQLIQKNYVIRHNINTNVVTISVDNEIITFDKNTKECKGKECDKYSDVVNMFIDNVLN